MFSPQDIEELKQIYMTKEDCYSGIKKLIKLFTEGFNRVDKAMARLEERDSILNNHEHRLDKI